MNDEKESLLQTLLSDYENSMIRVDGEKEHQTAIAKRAEMECACIGAHFKKLAAALHKDSLQQTRFDLGTQIELFNRVIGDRE